MTKVCENGTNLSKTGKRDEMSELSSKAKKLFDEFNYSQTVYHAFLASGINNEYIEKKRKMRDAKRESFEEYVVGLESRIAELELGLNNQTVHSNTLQKILTEKLDRIAELEAAQRWINLRRTNWIPFKPSWAAPAANKRYLVKLQNDWVCIATYYLRVGGGYWKDDKGQELTDGVVEFWKGLEE